MNTERTYEETTFWETRESWTVMGDWLGREPALQMLNPKNGETIIDAGCGEGLLTQAIACSGAHVIACDRSERMLFRAEEREEEKPSGITRFVLLDICERLPRSVRRVDAVNCVAVLMHDSADECAAFFRNVYAKLRSGGRLVISITHPYLYLPGSPTCDGRSTWTQFEPLEGDASMDVSRKFIEHYRNINGQMFDAEVWYHPEHLFPKLLQEAGLEVVKVQSTFVRAEHIAKSPLWVGSPSGHPAYYQILAVKP